ncbi:hypothetical protein SORBI_3002G103400 [Sorghum bicolor]|uniref:Uncharacterized protein n=1 Tax=Sorghum bicolor TaxID=4558 RepID=A0A1B6QAC5_SORBI|nr:hypothetical protein SORBI_3002G103400 [Sorghum bicolor]
MDEQHRLKARKSMNSGTQLSLVGTKKETSWLLVALQSTPAEGTADRDYGARISYQPTLLQKTLLSRAHWTFRGWQSNRLHSKVTVNAHIKEAGALPSSVNQYKKSKQNEKAHSPALARPGSRPRIATPARRRRHWGSRHCPTCTAAGVARSVTRGAQSATYASAVAGSSHCTFARRLGPCH